MISRQALTGWLIFLLAGAAYLAGNGRTPLFDRDEPRYAITSRNMLATGDWIVPRQYDRPRTAKPPLIYWAQATAMKLFSEDGAQTTSSFVARLPSSLAMLAVVGLMLVGLRRELSASARLTAAAVFAFSGLTLFLAKVCITDALLLLFVVLSEYSLYWLWRGRRGWSMFVTYGVATGLGGLTKGPVILGVQAMTLLVIAGMDLMERRWPAQASWKTFPLPAGLDQEVPSQRGGRFWVRTCCAAAIVIGITLPWVWLVEQRSPGFLHTGFQHDIYERTTHGVDGQKKFFGFYLLSVFGTFFPFCIFIPSALFLGWKNRQIPLARFCFAACLGPWLMFEASTSKMVHWFLPVFPPLAVLTGMSVEWCVAGKYQDFRSGGFRAFLVGISAACIAMATAPWIAVRAFGAPAWSAAVLSLLILSLATAFVILLWRGKIVQGILAAAGGMGVLAIVTFTWTIPSWGFLALGRDVGRDLSERQHSGAHEKVKVAMTDFREPSVAFYQGGSAREEELDALRRDDLDLITIVEDTYRQTTPALRDRWKVVGQFSGLAYAKSSKPVSVLILAPAHGR